MTIEEIKENIEEYLFDKNKNPLYFIDYYDEKVPIPNAKNLSLIDLIIKIIELNENDYLSWGEGIFEKFDYSYRTSLDIWRHVKFYKPEITIFEVMRCIYDNENIFISHVCHEINCRVFTLDDDRYGTMERFINQTELDEYGLTFYDWGSL